MTRLSILGVTGYTGAHLARVAAARGLDVTGFSRTAPEAPIDDVTYVQGSLRDAAVRQQAADADVVIGALSPRGDMAGEVEGVYAELADAARATGARFIVVGGFGSLRPAEGAPRFFEGDEFPADYKPESLELFRVYEALAAGDGLDWLYVSPAMVYGQHTPVADRGTTRVGGEVALFDADGGSELSGGDFATAIVDEIETPSRGRAHIGVIAA